MEIPFGLMAIFGGYLIVAGFALIVTLLWLVIEEKPIKVDMVWRWGSFWIGAHWSGPYKRLCINVLPFITVRVVFPGGRAGGVVGRLRRKDADRPGSLRDSFLGRRIEALDEEFKQQERLSRELLELQCELGREASYRERRAASGAVNSRASEAMKRLHEFKTAEDAALFTSGFHHERARNEQRKGVSVKPIVATPYQAPDGVGMSIVDMINEGKLKGYRARQEWAKSGGFHSGGTVTVEKAGDHAGYPDWSTGRADVKRPRTVDVHLTACACGRIVSRHEVKA